MLINTDNDADLLNLGGFPQPLIGGKDIEASTVAIKSWLRLFEILHFGILLRPFHRRLALAVKKEPKWYFEQWAYNTDSGARFENYLAIQAAAACSAWREQGFGKWELAYLRDQDRREIDFVLVKDVLPQVLIDAKAGVQGFTTPALHYYGEKLKLPAMLVYPEGPTKRVEDKGFCLSPAALLKGLVLRWGARSQSRRGCCQLLVSVQCLDG